MKSNLLKQVHTILPNFKGFLENLEGIRMEHLNLVCQPQVIALLTCIELEDPTTSLPLDLNSAHPVKNKERLMVYPLSG